jgi:hypothetical protein
LEILLERCNEFKPLPSPSDDIFLILKKFFPDKIRTYSYISGRAEHLPMRNYDYYYSTYLKKNNPFNIASERSEP